MNNNQRKNLSETLIIVSRIGYGALAIISLLMALVDISKGDHQSLPFLFGISFITALLLYRSMKAGFPTDKS